MTKPDFRALCAELLDELDLWSSWHDATDLKDRAGAALDLAQPEPPELTDEELLRTYGKAKRDHCYEGDLDDWPKKAELAATVAGLRAAITADRARRPTPQPPADGEVAELVGSTWCAVDDPSHKKYDRAADLLRHPQPPADGEVAELVRYLKQESEEMGYQFEHEPSRKFRRAAELLQRQHPQPVPVSERQPGPEHCDRWGECWTTDYDPSLAYTPVWKMTELPRQDLGHNFSNAYFWRNVKFWLPANALPTPGAPNV